jgi:hypothetical protein
VSRSEQFTGDEGPLHTQARVMGYGARAVRACLGCNLPASVNLESEKRTRVDDSEGQVMPISVGPIAFTIPTLAAIREKRRVTSTDPRCDSLPA